MSVRKKNIIICAGGTGGHVFPAKKLCELLLKEDCKIKWIGSSRGPEEKICEQLGIEFYSYPLMGFRGKPLFLKIISLINLIYSATRFFFEFQFKNLFDKKNILICFGGYISLLGLFHFAGPIYIQEQNSIPGTANRYLAKYKNVKKIFCGFPNALEFFKENNVIFTGNLINLNIGKVFNKTLNPKKLQFKIMGGSQGARVINNCLPKIFKKISIDFPEAQISIHHQCGKGNLKKTKSLYESLMTNCEIEIFEFAESMEKFYSNCDLLISRAGALSVSEVCETNNIAIFVPLKDSIDNHQYENAKFLEEKNSAFICNENNLENNLKELIYKIVKEPKLITKMKKNISRISLSDNQNIILENILSNE